MMTRSDELHSVHIRGSARSSAISLQRRPFWQGCHQNIQIINMRKAQRELSNTLCHFVEYYLLVCAHAPRLKTTSAILQPDVAADASLSHSGKKYSFFRTSPFPSCLMLVFPFTLPACSLAAALRITERLEGEAFRILHGVFTLRTRLSTSLSIFMPDFIRHAELKNFFDFLSFACILSISSFALPPPTNAYQNDNEQLIIPNLATHSSIVRCWIGDHTFS